MIFLFLGNLVAYIKLKYNLFMNKADTQKHVDMLIYYLIFVVWLLISFCRLVYKMKTYHNFEYQLHKKHAGSFIFFILVGYSLVVMNVMNSWLNITGVNGNQFDMETFCVAKSSSLKYISNLIFV